MAVKKSLQFPGGIKVPDSYLMIDRITVDRVHGRVGYAIVGYIDEATRRAAGEAFARLATAHAEANAANTALNVAQTAAAGPSPDAAAAAARRKAMSTAATKQIAAQAELAEAQAEAQEGHIAPVFEAANQTLDPIATVKVLRADGTLDVAAFYAALKAPGQLLEGGADA